MVQMKTVEFAFEINWPLASNIPNQAWKGLPGLRSVKGQMLAKLAVAF